jgi:hypothetical protein
MANERLRSAMNRCRATVAALATAAEVDPKTVSRWLGGRVPHPRHRWAVAKYLHEDQEFLWPGAEPRSADSSAASAEVIAAYPYRSSLPTSAWWSLITRAERQIDLLGYTLYFLPMDHPQLVDTFREKCEEGCVIRAAIADPKSRHVADRDKEEDLALTLGVRIQTTLKYLGTLVDCQNFDLRYQDVPLYNSVFRFDDDMLVTPHLYATPGSSAPLLHLRRLGPNGLFSRFSAHFEGIWHDTKPIGNDQSPKALRGGA